MELRRGHGYPGTRIQDLPWEQKRTSCCDPWTGAFRHLYRGRTSCVSVWLVGTVDNGLPFAAIRRPCLCHPYVVPSGPTGGRYLLLRSRPHLSPWALGRFGLYLLCIGQGPERMAGRTTDCFRKGRRSCCEPAGFHIRSTANFTLPQRTGECKTTGLPKRHTGGRPRRNTREKETHPRNKALCTARR